MPAHRSIRSHRRGEEVRNNTLRVKSNPSISEYRDSGCSWPVTVSVPGDWHYSPVRLAVCGPVTPRWDSTNDIAISHMPAALGQWRMKNAHQVCLEAGRSATHFRLIASVVISKIPLYFLVEVGFLGPLILALLADQYPVGSHFFSSAGRSGR